MSCVTAVGATGSYDEESLKVHVKKESKENSSFIEKALIGTTLTILTGLGLYKLFGSKNTEKQNNQKPKLEEVNIQNQNSEKPETKKTYVHKKVKTVELFDVDTKNLPSDVSEISWHEALLCVNSLCGQKSVREYVENSSDMSPGIVTLKYLFGVLRGEKEYDRVRFLNYVNYLRYYLLRGNLLPVRLSFVNRRYLDENINNLTYGTGYYRHDDIPADFLAHYVKNHDGDYICAKDGFTLTCRNDVSSEPGKFLIKPKEILICDKKYELTAISFWKCRGYYNQEKYNIMIKREDGSWWGYYIDDECEPFIKCGEFKKLDNEKIESILNRPSSDRIELTYSVR